MARQVKCAITGECGSSDTFIKIGNKYYKSQKIYDIDKKEKDARKEIIRFICEDLLNYTSGQMFPSLVTRKLKELDFYDNEVILLAFKENKDAILYQINQDRKFNNEQGKIFYMFAIINNTINDVNKQFKRNKTIENKMIIEDVSLIFDMGNINTKQKDKDLRKWIDEEEQ